MQEVIILRGLPASGKSTWAKELIKTNPNKYKRINKDLLRLMIDCGNFSSINEKFILKIRDRLIIEYLDEGFDVIVDDTNLAGKHIIRIKQLVGRKANVIINDSFLEVPLEECIKRDMNRENSVGIKVIKNMYETYIEKISRNSVGKIFKIKDEHSNSPEYNPDLPDCIIVDIDGTVAIHNGRSPYDFKKCDTDLPNLPIIDLIKYYDAGIEFYQERGEDDKSTKIIFMSGREDSVYKMTLEWLNKNVITVLDDMLFMRKTGDYRKDVIVKKEIYEEHIKGKYNVRFVLDDRSSVVRGWRLLGLTCLQVADGDF